jgi:glycosyltransferase involved in cell wall biosynthesis
MEAASSGLPIIASNVTAHTDYLTNDNSFLVEPDGYIQANVNGNLSSMAKLCHFYVGQTFPDFSNTGVEQTRRHMRFIFENYKEAKEKAEKLRKLIIGNYTWEMAIDRVYRRLREIA